MVNESPMTWTHRAPELHQNFSQLFQYLQGYAFSDSTISISASSKGREEQDSDGVRLKKKIKDNELKERDVRRSAMRIQPLLFLHPSRLAHLQFSPIIIPIEIANRL